MRVSEDPVGSAPEAPPLPAALLTPLHPAPGPADSGALSTDDVRTTCNVPPSLLEGVRIVTRSGGLPVL